MICKVYTHIYLEVLLGWSLYQLILHNIVKKSGRESKSMVYI